MESFRNSYWFLLYCSYYNTETGNPQKNVYFSGVSLALFKSQTLLILSFHHVDFYKYWTSIYDRNNTTDTAQQSILKKKRIFCANFYAGSAKSCQTGLHSLVFKFLIWSRHGNTGDASIILEWFVCTKTLSPLCMWEILVLLPTSPTCLCLLS